MKVLRQARSGYALITTLLILSLIIILVVAMLGVGQRVGRRNGLERDRAEARANALLALDTALAQLQRYAGPDQAVSACADILSNPDDASADFPNPKWTGIWSSTEEAVVNQSPGAFLVSGNEAFKIDSTTTSYPTGYHDPAEVLDETDRDVIELVAADPNSSEGQVLVRKQPVHETASGIKKGHFSYWVGDEGVKAKVNLVDPFRESTDDLEKSYRFTLAQRQGIEAVLPDFNAADDRLESVSTLSDINQLQDEPDSEKMSSHFHDITTHSIGLLTDTKNGGLKRDLTLAFESDELFERLFGAKKSAVVTSATVSSKDLYQLDVNRLNEFYLVPEILETAVGKDSNYGRWIGGPNWGNLREYYLLKDRSVNDIPFLPHPRCGVKMRHYSFNPYKHGNRGGKYDFYQRNSPLCPILSRAQMSIRLKAREVPGGSPSGEPQYTIELEVQPVVGLWNPYNIEFTSRIYRFDWEISIFVDLKIGGVTKRYDLYRLWNKSSSPWFSLNSEAIDFQPGEFRLFTVDSRQPLRQNVKIVPRWSEDGAFWVTLPNDPDSPSGSDLVVDGKTEIEIEKVGLVAAVESQNWSNALKELQKHNTFMAIKYGESVGSASSNVENSSVRMNNLWKASDESGPKIVPEEDDAVPPFMASQHTDTPNQLATWSYYLRTSREDVLGHRNFIDSNVRAIVANSRWDGSVEDRGWRSMGWLNDGVDRALLPPGNEEPEADGIERYRGFGGDSIGATGQTHSILFDVPRAPLVSIGQLQHANLGRYNNEPSFVVGNSYHNIRIPLDQTEVRDFAQHDTKGLYSDKELDVFDLSYRVNEELWDSWFFSTVDVDDISNQIDELKSGGESLPNSRFHLYDPANSFLTSFEAAEAEADHYDVLGAHLLVNGAFNVNSTSVAAWKVVLSSIRDVEIPVVDPQAGTEEWVQSKIVFSRFVRPFSSGFDPDDSATFENYWRGYRTLSDEQIGSIAEELVRQVKLRGPFRSMAEFVNRTLEDKDPSSAESDDSRLSGPLQAALDRAEGGNRNIDEDLSAPVEATPDAADEFSGVEDGSRQGTAHPGYLLQGDVLQPLAPILSARSDTFRIRAYGDKIIVPRDSSNDMEFIKARAWCEAIVQRIPDPVEPVSEDSSSTVDMIQRAADIETHYRSLNKPYFGRKFRIVAFRWLEKDEL